MHWTRHSRKLLRLSFLWLAAFAVASVSVAQARDDEGPDVSPASGRQSVAREANQLYQSVYEISHSMGISTSKKEKRIATAVRVSVVAATAYKSDPDAVLGIALELTRAAVRAAPRFAEVISSSVSYASSVARIEGSAGRVRAVAYATAKAPTRRRLAETEPAASPVPERRHVAEEPQPQTQADVADTAAQVDANVPAKASDMVASGQAESPPAPAEAAQAEAQPESAPLPASAVAQSDDTKLSVTANVMVQHDDNVFISNANKVGDTIYSIEPGAEFHAGQNSLNHASLSYQEDFVRYQKHTAPNVSLANAAGNFGYDDGGLKLAADGTYQQLFQNNVDVLTLGPQALIRSSTLALNGSGELELGAKTSASVGVAFTKMEYSNPGLLGGQDVNFPVDAYYKLTPKLDVFAGYTYGFYRPDGSGPEAKDGYAHIGGRGDFTSKLSGTVSAGYITRSIAGTAKNGDFGFTGSLNYEVTPKTEASLALSRDYNTSALGQNQKNSNFTLGATSEISPQWQLGESISYQILDYGPQVFLLKNTLVNQERIDDFWNANIHLTYIYSRWMSGSMGYTARVDHSTFSQIDFTDNLFNLTLSLRY